MDSKQRVAVLGLDWMMRQLAEVGVRFATPGYRPAALAAVAQSGFDRLRRVT